VVGVSSFTPSGLVGFALAFPMAYAMGFILAPLCGLNSLESATNPALRAGLSHRAASRLELGRVAI
jgi:hypothetical protein